MSIFNKFKNEKFILIIIIILSSATIFSFIKPEYCNPTLAVATTTLCISIVGGVYQYLSYIKSSNIYIKSAGIADYFSKTKLKKSFNSYWRKIEKILPFKKDDFDGKAHSFVSTVLTKEQFDQIKDFQDLNDLYWIIQNKRPELLLPFAKNVSSVSESIKNDFETFQDCYNDFILTHKNGDFDKEHDYFDFRKLWEFHMDLLSSYTAKNKDDLNIRMMEPTPECPFYSIRIIFMLNEERRKQLGIFKKQFNEWMDVAV
jgi:hypothetical protein